MQKRARAFLGILATLIVTVGIAVWMQRMVSVPIVDANGPVSAEQIRAALTDAGWTNIVISERGNRFEVIGDKSGERQVLTVDAKSGRGIYDND